MTRVLVLEDDVELGLEIVESFATNGFEAEFHCSVADALESFETHRHEVLIADLVIRDTGEDVVHPGAVSLFQRVRFNSHASGSAVPLLLLISGSSMVENGSWAWQASGADRLVRKPFEASAIVTFVREMLAEREQAEDSGQAFPERDSNVGEDSTGG